MKIEQYISQLLYRYQCVTVPGFGAFLTDYQSAKIDEKTPHSQMPIHAIRQNLSVYCYRAFF